MINNHSQQLPSKVIAITGGKGGIGKTSVSINLGMALAEKNKNVLLFDADLGLANVDICLGIKPKKNIKSVLSGESSINDVVVNAANRFDVIPASSGSVKLAELSRTEHVQIIDSFNQMLGYYDVMLIDTAAGISDMVTSFLRASQEVLVVLSPEPAALADAYALIKVMHKYSGMQKFRVLVNMVKTAHDARRVFNRLQSVTDIYLDVLLQFSGFIPEDDFLKKALSKHQSVIQAYPRSKSAFAFRNLADGILKWRQPSGPSGNIEFFWERLIEPAVIG